MIPLIASGYHTELLSSDELAAMPLPELRLWCYRTGRYGLVTRELVDWLHQIIAGRNAIEVGSGQGDLGFHLQIPMTDSAIQSTGWVRFLYDLMKQTATDPPPDVERMDAQAALAK